MRHSFLPSLFRCLLIAGFLIAVKAYAQPTITSPSPANGKVGDPFTYTIETDIPALGYSSTALPDGLSRSGDTISGTPNEAGNYGVTLTAFDDTGAGSPFLLAIIINDSNDNPPPQLITSSLEEAEFPGASFTYQIESSVEAIDYAAFGIGGGTDLPNLSIDTTTGIISGTLPSVPGKYDVVLVANYADGTSATATLVIEVVAAPTPSIVLLEPMADQIISVGNTVDFEGSASTTAGNITAVDLLQDGVIVQTLSASPFVFSQTFNSPGVYEMSLQATNSLGVTAESESITVYVEQQNPVIRDSDFIEQTFMDLFYRAPSTTELNNGLDYLDDGNTRGEYVALLMGQLIDQLDITETLQIYRVAGGFWPDYTTLQQQLSDFRNIYGSDGTEYANSLATEFRAKYPNIRLPINAQNPEVANDDTFDYDEWQNELAFIDALYQNKYGVNARDLDLVFSINTLAVAFYNTTNNGGDMVANFATTNRYSGNFEPGSGFPLSVVIDNTQPPGDPDPAAVWGFAIPNTKFPARVQASQLISGLLREQPTNDSVKALTQGGPFDLAAVAQELLDSPEYKARFNTSFTLEVDVSGSGSVEVVPYQVDPSDTSVYLYNDGTTVVLTATPDAGYQFDGWTGDITSSDNPLSVTLTEDVDVTANFSLVLLPTASLVAEKMEEEGGVTDPDSIDPSVDYDGDGATNLEEVVFGTDATSSNSTPVFETRIENDTFVYEAIVLKQSELPADLTVQFECSAQLGADDWDLVPSSQITTVGVSQADVPNGYERVRVTLPLDSDCFFLRGKLTVND